MKIKFTANAVKWFDRVNGNTYHSVNITRHRDGKMLFCPFEYGYGDHYRQTALEAMDKAKWLPLKYRRGSQLAGSMWDAWKYERENNYPILWNVSNGLKKECIANGTR